MSKRETFLISGNIQAGVQNKNGNVAVGGVVNQENNRGKVNRLRMESFNNYY